MKPKEFKYTPRPWAAREVFNHTEGHSSHVIVWRDGTDANHQYRRLGRDGNFTEQDARLIAAAPDLLNAAVRVLELWDNNGNPAGAFELLRAAIAKAEGK